MKEDIYAIKYKNDELDLELTTCKQPWLCTCNLSIDESPKCGYTAQEAHQRFIEYYQRRVDLLKSISTAQFMRDLGFYHIEGE